MKKMITAAIAAGFIAAPAFAASITVSFANDDGTTAEWTFDGEGTATSGDLSTSYTWDEEAMKLCADVPEQGEICAQPFDAVAEAKLAKAPATRCRPAVLAPRQSRRCPKNRAKQTFPEYEKPGPMRPGFFLT